MAPDPPEPHGWIDPVRGTDEPRAQRVPRRLARDDQDAARALLSLRDGDRGPGPAAGGEALWHRVLPHASRSALSVTSFRLLSTSSRAASRRASSASRGTRIGSP